LKYAVLGDIHGNLQALEAVLQEVDKESVDGILCVGDIVGYGANPEECIQVLRDRAAIVVAGNHDWGGVGKTSIEFFNSDAKDSIIWTQEQLSEADEEYICRLPLVIEGEDYTIVHGTLYLPEYFDYVHTLYDAHLTFCSLKTRVCFLGHSHIPIVFFNGNPISYFLESEIDLSISSKTIVNVGSVGQPRDLESRASVAIYDTVAQAALAEANLPATNGSRLALGR